MTQQPFAPAVQVTRGMYVESAHRGSIAAVDVGGRLVASLGNPVESVYLRSCAKPFQALAFVCSGAADGLGITEEELAVACASHSGEPEHQERVASILRKAGLDESALRCGVHPPFDGPTREAMQARGARPTALHNNCSGKHAAMLATARFLDLPTDTYTDPDHAIQIAIRGILGYLCGLEPEEIQTSPDGCTAPSFRIPLRSFSLALARLAAEGEGVPHLRARSSPSPHRHRRRHDHETASDEDEDLDVYDRDPDERAEASDSPDPFPVPITEGMRRVWTAMRAHPHLVAGRHGRLCTDLMQAAASFEVPLVAKSGAEGAYAVATVRDGAGLGITIKIEDGAQRARDSAIIETLFQLGILPDDARGPLAGYHRQTVLNLRQEPVGEIRSIFKLSLGLPS